MLVKIVLAVQTPRSLSQWKRSSRSRSCSSSGSDSSSDEVLSDDNVTY
jgi:hypothetical protein